MSDWTLPSGHPSSQDKAKGEDKAESEKSDVTPPEIVRVDAVDEVIEGDDTDTKTETGTKAKSKTKE